LISFLCFSKDRPLQVDGYIRSLKKASGDKNIDLSVLYTHSGDDFVGPYVESLMSRENSWASPIREVNFREDVLEWLYSAKHDLVCFGCDDVVYNGYINWKHVKKFFSRLDGVAYSFRLGRNITNSFMTRIILPKFAEEFPIMTWRIGLVKGDWQYAFELDGTVYRKDDIVRLLESVDFKCPNTLEGNAVKLFHKQQEGNLMGCPQESVLSVVTVNRVQTKFNRGKVYKDTEVSSEYLIKIWRDGFRLNLDAYWDRSFDRIHIGDFLIKGPV